jgi:hypothetical protein
LAPSTANNTAVPSAQRPSSTHATICILRTFSDPATVHSIR